MTVMEFFGCAFVALGPPLAMFLFTIAHDPIKVIILIGAAFFWLLSLLLSSLIWFAVIPLRTYLMFGVVFSILFQETFRFLVYKILRHTELSLMKITENNLIINNKHILAYVSGMGFGLISGAFSIVNILSDAAGPATMGLNHGNEMFFITSAATTLCFILLHTFWSVIFFNGFDANNKLQIGFVVASHVLASSLTILNRYRIYSASLIPLFVIVILTGIYAFKIAGGSFVSLKNSISLRQ